MSFHKTTVVLGLLLVLGFATTSPAAPLAREILGSELLVKEYLDKLEVPVGQIWLLEEEVLIRAFPDYLFFGVSYPAESATHLPAPLKQVNVFAVAPTGKVILLVDPVAIVEFFQFAFNPGKDIPRCKEAVRATLLLLKARYPDQQFRLLDEEIKIANDPNKGRLGVGKLVVMEGGTGTIEVALTLNQRCDPLKLVETITVTPAQRQVVAVTAAQIAAAEKVVKEQVVALKLSVDPVKYVDDPTLIAAFPGWMFFLAPSADPKIGAKVESLNMMVVGPNGKPVSLLGSGNQFGVWFNSAFGPAASDPRITEGIKLWSRVLQVTHPTLQFDPPGAPEITTDEGGHQTIFTKTTAVAPGGRRWLLTVRFMYGKHGRLVAWWWGLRAV
jgi:hypothetical protein